VWDICVLRKSTKEERVGKYVHYAGYCCIITKDDVGNDKTKLRLGQMKDLPLLVYRKNTLSV
jgi:hypothetical protein